MSLTLLSPPASEPVTLAELKEHLRVAHDDDDALIAGFLVAAVRAIEARAGLAFLPQQWRLTLDEAPGETVILPVAPVSVAEVSVIDTQGDPHTLDAALYEFAPGAPGRLRPAGLWPSPGVRLDGVRIDFTAGHADAASVPSPLKQAAKLLAAHFYENRESAGEARIHAVPRAVDALIAPYREFRL